MFGPNFPDVRYLRCDRPLSYMADHLRHVAVDDKIDYAVFDSIAFACDGPPEAAEVAGRYFQAVRRIGIGSLHIAHVSKAEGADQKPFGSAFWHNGARATWNVSVANSSRDGAGLSVGLFNRKFNLGPLQPAVAFDLTFDAERTRIRQVNAADVAELAEKLPAHLRIKRLVGSRARSVQELAEELGESQDTVRKAVLRHPKMFGRQMIAGENKIVLLDNLQAASA